MERIENTIAFLFKKYLPAALHTDAQEFPAITFPPENLFLIGFPGEHSDNYFKEFETLERLLLSLLRVPKGEQLILEYYMGERAGAAMTLQKIVNRSDYFLSSVMELRVLLKLVELMMASKFIKIVYFNTPTQKENKLLIMFYNEFVSGLLLDVATKTPSGLYKYIGLFVDDILAETAETKLQVLSISDQKYLALRKDYIAGDYFFKPGRVQVA